jgi:hypothetical protein
MTPQLGYRTKEGFIRDAIHFKPTWLSEELKYIRKEQCDLLNRAAKEMSTPHEKNTNNGNARAQVH